MTEAPVTDLDLAEVERLLEAPQGLVETVALARVVPALLSALKAERERAAGMQAALRKIADEVAGPHWKPALDPRAIARAALGDRT